MVWLGCEEAGSYGVFTYLAAVLVVARLVESDEEYIFCWRCFTG